MIRISGCPAWCQVAQDEHAAQSLDEDRLGSQAVDPMVLEDALSIMYDGDVPPRHEGRLQGLVHKATWADDERRWWVDAGVATDDQGRLEEMPHLIVGCDHLGISTEEARALVAALLQAADALDATELYG